MNCKETLEKLNSISNYYIPKNLLEKFASDIFNSLLHNHDSVGGIDFASFQDYIQFPIFISQKLFNLFTLGNSERLITKAQFINLFTSMYSSSAEVFERLIFDLFDFDYNDSIQKTDIEIVTYHFHYNTNDDHLNGTTFDSTIEIIKSILDPIFKDSVILSYDEYYNLIHQENSDLIYLYKLFFFVNKPFHQEELQFYSEHAFNGTKDTNDKQLTVSFLQPTMNLINYFSKFYKDIQPIVTEEEEEPLDDEDILQDLVQFEQDIVKSKLIEINKNVFLTLPQQTHSDLNLSTSSLGSFKSEQNNQSIFHNAFKCYIGKNHSIVEQTKHAHKKRIFLIKNIIFVYNKEHQYERLIYINNVIDIDFKRVENHFVLSIKFLNDEYPSTIVFVFSSNRKATKFMNMVSQLKHSIDSIYDFDEKKEMEKGGFGTVFNTKNKATNEELVIKEIPRNVTNDYWEISICNLLKNISHPNLIRIYGVYETLTHILIVMEKGSKNLGSYIKDNFFLNISDKFEIVCQIAKGISCLHSLGIIHRDIKLENILIERSNGAILIKLIDFGLSKIMGLDESTNEPFGTMNYMAPEIFLRNNYNHKEDIWSFGIVVFYILKNRFPFAGIWVNSEYSIFELTIQVLYKNLSRDVKNSQFKKERILLTIINNCLEKQIQKRVDIKGILNYMLLALQ